jgi:hypothetical protein
MYLNPGLGQNSAADAALAFDPTLSALGVTASSFPSALLTTLGTQVPIGTSTIPLWGLAGAAIAALFIANAMVSGTRKVTTRVSSRAKKIKRGFVN